MASTYPAYTLWCRTARTARTHARKHARTAAGVERAPLLLPLAYIVMAYIVMAYIIMAYIVTTTAGVECAQLLLPLRQCRGDAGVRP